MSFFSLSSYFLGIVASLVVTFVTYFKWSYQYWKRKNIQHLEPEIPYGNLKSIKGKEHFATSMKNMYNEMKAKSWKYGGVYILATPSLMVLDLSIVKNILKEDFQYFMDRNMYFNERDDPISANLAVLAGDRWKNMRSMLTPTFTSSKIKMMFQSLPECEASLHRLMDEKVTNKEVINIREVVACFTTDVIGSCAFGLDCKAIERDDSPFRIYGKKAVESSRLQTLKRSFATSFPTLAKFLRIVTVPRDVSEFFIKTVKDTVDYREKNNIKRNDVLQLLMEIKNNDKVGLTIEEIAAHSFAFFGGGFDTSSTLMSFALYELARHQDIQQKLRNEINSVLKNHDGKLTYDAIQDMKYLTRVIEESFRKYPPTGVVNRMCVADYKVPDEEIIIKKGVTVIIPIIGIHYDKDYYPDPDKFDPDRFNDENKNTRPKFTFLPFGEGPRICIGMRFALTQAKMGLASLLRKYKFTVNDRTIQPLKFAPHKLILSAQGHIWLNAEKI